MTRRLQIGMTNYPFAIKKSVIADKGVLPTPVKLASFDFAKKCRWLFQTLIVKMVG
jgi:hypothetical protein